jgi:predicted metal-binding membrane protein
VTEPARARNRIRLSVLAAGGAAWAWLAVAPAGVSLPMLCGVHGFEPTVSVSVVRSILTANPPAALACGWTVMVAAMMLPALCGPIEHIRSRVLARRRAHMLAVFLAAYLSVWLIAGVPILAAALALRHFAPNSTAALCFAAGLALLWQTSPLKQRCLNGCHARPAILAFGRAAGWSAARYGASYGASCAGSCWAIMLLVSAASARHLPLMLLAAAWVLAERLERPRTPRWHFAGVGKALRLARDWAGGVSYGVAPAPRRLSLGGAASCELRRRGPAR